MDLPQLKSDKLLLALDVVAGWQIEKIKSKQLWESWDEAMNTVRVYEDDDYWRSLSTPTSSRLRLVSQRLMRLPVEGNGIIHFSGGVYLRKKKFYLVVVAMNDEQKECCRTGFNPDPTTVPEDMMYGEIDCAHTKPTCVRILLRHGINSSKADSVYF